MKDLPGVGRPTDYRPEYDVQALDLCELGATDQDLAAHFGVTVNTIANWRHRNESFAIASRVGKQHADEEVKRSAFMLAKGYTYTEKQAIKIKVGPHLERVEIVEVERVMPPNAMMQAKWLAVRGNKEFAEVQKLEHSGAIKTSAIDLTTLTDDQLSKYMAFMESVTTQETET